VPVSPLAGNVKIMNKTPFERPSNSEDKLLPEYQFDYKKAKPNHFANRSGKPMAQMLLQSAVEKYREELKELDKEE
jgi:hypothetical protein